MNYIHRYESAIYYECGYSCDNAIFLKIGDDSYFITDGRYAIEAKREINGAEVVIDSDILKRANSILKNSSIKKCNYDPKEWSCYSFDRLSRGLNIDWRAKVDMSHKKRIIKKDYEIKLIERAVKLGKVGFKRAEELISIFGVGESEFKILQLAKGAMSNYGKLELSFEPIVAIGANASKPHSKPNNRTLSCGDLLLFDAGVKYKRYCSDRTRTVIFDDNFSWEDRAEFGSKRVQKAYDTVKKAHDKAIKKARVGMRAKDIDKIVRNIIEKAGFGKYFVHSTGHGVGLDIHEMPYISPKSKTVIEDSMVFTIEPGIYVEGEFGIRIEDMVVMKNGRAEIL
jgi:Xaa-Pro aminopeptidase